MINTVADARTSGWERADLASTGGVKNGGSRLYLADVCFFRPLSGLRRGLREVLTMWEIIVGLIGMALIAYLLVVVIHPEKF